MHLSPQVALAVDRSKVVVLLLTVTPIVGICNCSMFCCAFLCVQPNFAIISKGRYASCFSLFVFLVSPDCCVALPHDVTFCLQFVIVVFPDHNHLLFFSIQECIRIYEADVKKERHFQNKYISKT